MATLEKPDMPILRESADEIYQRMANRMVLLAQKRGETPPAMEEGEIFYDLLYPVALEISEQQQLLEYAFFQGFLPWADGEFLDAHGYLIGLPRKVSEEDEPYRLRLLDRVRTEEGNGRVWDYENWARSIPGVGDAVGVEKERHDNSIDLYITDFDGAPVSPDFAEGVQVKMEEFRIALHDLQVHPAILFNLEVKVTLQLEESAVGAEIIDAITKRLKAQIRGKREMVYQQIGAHFFVAGVTDYFTYTLNGRTDNLTLPRNAAPSLQLVVTFA